MYLTSCFTHERRRPISLRKEADTPMEHGSAAPEPAKESLDLAADQAARLQDSPKRPEDYRDALAVEPEPTVDEELVDKFYFKRYVGLRSCWFFYYHDCPSIRHLSSSPSGLPATVICSTNPDGHRSHECPDCCSEAIIESV